MNDIYLQLLVASGDRPPTSLLHTRGPRRQRRAAARRLPRVAGRVPTATRPAPRRAPRTA